MSDQRPPSSDRASQKRRKLVVMAVVSGVAAAGLGAAVTLNWPMASVVGANPGNPEQVAMGQAVYQQNCASCHGAKLEGQPEWQTRKPDGKLPAPPHDEAGHTWHHPDKVLFRLTKNGMKPPLAPVGYKSDMPAFEGVLSDEQVWAVLSYIKTSWPPKARTRQDRMNEAYEQ
ncbi:MAG: cytochrome c [Proteobacteria bacterium]|nr:cytochrome c [Pseudomonadota bacterium]